MKTTDTQPSRNQLTQIELDSIARRRAHGYAVINTDMMLGYTVKIPFTEKIMSRPMDEQDEWAKDQLRARGFKPLFYTHVKPLYGSTATPGLFFIESYTYRKQALDEHIAKKKEQQGNGQ